MKIFRRRAIKMVKTKIIKVNIEEPEIEKIRFAAKVIKEGGLVAFPTETVYGLGANAFNSKAIKKIFQAKKRPLDNPIIVHISNKKGVFKLAKEFPKYIDKLLDYFWPGPLTVVLKALRTVPKVTTSGLNTVAIRMPDHKVAMALIKETNLPIAAPSANLAGRPSPTMAKHVIKDLDGKIDVILNAGSTRIGVESTVLDLTSDPPQILRPGGATYEDLKKILGKVKLHKTLTTMDKIKMSQVASPGMKHKHYAPNAELILVEGKTSPTFLKIQQIVKENKEKGKKVGILATDENKLKYKADMVKSLGSRHSTTLAAKNLFKFLREFDDEKVDIIVAESVTKKRLGLAVMNRLRRASNHTVIKV
jgi:L-threonylcarbamoyladenylate synthase